ncbi:hypothetical protein V6Z11_D03G145000 [Gossypium hirsutum]
MLVEAVPMPYKCGNSWVSIGIQVKQGNLYFNGLNICLQIIPNNRYLLLLQFGHYGYREINCCTKAKDIPLVSYVPLLWGYIRELEALEDTQPRTTETEMWQSPSDS